MGIDILDRTIDAYHQAVLQAYPTLQSDVALLFFTCLVIATALSAMYVALGDGTFTHANLIRRVLFVSFVSLILSNWAALADLSLRSFESIGATIVQGMGLSVTILPEDMTAGGILKYGMVYLKGFLDAFMIIADAQSATTGSQTAGLALTLVDTVIFIISIVIIYFCFIIMAVQYFLLKVSFYILILGVYVMLPFAVFSRLSWIAAAPFMFLITNGLRLLLIVIIFNVGISVFEGLETSGEDITEYLRNSVSNGGQGSLLLPSLRFAAASLTLMVIMMNIPSIFTAMLNGRSTITVGQIASSFVTGRWYLGKVTPGIRG